MNRTQKNQIPPDAVERALCGDVYEFFFKRLTFEVMHCLAFSGKIDQKKHVFGCHGNTSEYFKWPYSPKRSVWGTLPMVQVSFV